MPIFRSDGLDIAHLKKNGLVSNFALVRRQVNRNSFKYGGTTDIPYVLRFQVIDTPATFNPIRLCCSSAHDLFTGETIMHDNVAARPNGNAQNRDAVANVMRIFSSFSSTMICTKNILFASNYSLFVLDLHTKFTITLCSYLSIGPRFSFFYIRFFFPSSSPHTRPGICIRWPLMLYARPRYVIKISYLN